MTHGKMIHVRAGVAQLILPSPTHSLLFRPEAAVALTAGDGNR